MTPNLFQELYAYNFWANRRVWDCLEQLSVEQFNHADDNADSLREQCAHVMGVEFWWIRFLATGALEFLSEADYATRPAVRATWDNVQVQVRAYLETLTEQELEREVRPEFWDAERKPIRVWEALFQVLNHSTDHRAQMLATVKQFGGATIEQDFLGYLFERQTDAKAK